jgi:hypothetical protein
MSGRRSKSSEGIPTGILIQWRWGKAKGGRGFANQNGDGMLENTTAKVGKGATLPYASGIQF